jgi:hypothetical protein
MPLDRATDRQIGSYPSGYHSDNPAVGLWPGGAL